jgi:hypothetical protein
VRYVQSRSQSNEEGDLLCEVVLLLGKSIEHLSGSLRVSNVSQLLATSLVKDVVNGGSNIFCSHFFEGEIPELFLFCAQCGMVEAVLVSS